MFGFSVLVTESNRLALTNSLAKLTKRSNEVYLKKKHHTVSIDNAKN